MARTAADSINTVSGIRRLGLGPSRLLSLSHQYMRGTPSAAVDVSIKVHLNDLPSSRNGFSLPDTFTSTLYDQNPAL
jgi:hypothetical protein